VQRYGCKISIVCFMIALAACGEKKRVGEQTSFTKIDSLTENYLSLQDSLLQTWNAIVKDENRKINSMHEILRAFLTSRRYDKSRLIALEQRLDQLERIRFTQKTIANPHIIEEYDFESNSLMFEIISMAESDAAFQGNKLLQQWVDNIKIADQRIAIYRSDYDSVATAFNSFLDKYEPYLSELDQNLSKEKRPLFQTAEN
jgi:hypothetical protein